MLRAGFGITNDPYPMSRPLRSPFPAVIVDQYDPANSFVAAGSLETGIPAVKFPDISSGVVSIPNTIATNSLQAGKFRRGYIESFNFTVQRDLIGGFVLTTGYAGTRSIRQALTYFEANAGLVPGAGQDGRPFFTKFGVNANRSLFIPMATNRYDAWQSNVTRRFSQGLFVTSSFTWSKAIGINAGNSDSGLRFYVPSQFSKNKSVLDFDRTLSWTSAVNYQLPFGKGKQYATSGPAAGDCRRVADQSRDGVLHRHAIHRGYGWLILERHAGGGSDSGGRSEAGRCGGRPSVLRYHRVRGGA